MSDWPYLVIALLALAAIVVFWAASRPTGASRPPARPPFERSDVEKLD